MERPKKKRIARRICQEGARPVTKFIAMPRLIATIAIGLRPKASDNAPKVKVPEELTL